MKHGLFMAQTQVSEFWGYPQMIQVMITPHQTRFGPWAPPLAAVDASPEILLIDIDMHSVLHTDNVV